VRSHNTDTLFIVLIESDYNECTDQHTNCSPIQIKITQ